MRWKTLLLAFAGACVLLFLFQETVEESVPEARTRVLRIAISTNGSITLDGVGITLPELETRLGAESGQDVEVWYYREQGEFEAGEVPMQVIAAIVDARLPVSLSSEADYSTVVLPDGSIVPR